MRHLFVGITIMVLTGCAAIPSAPVVQEVSVPVSVPCRIVAPEAPAFAVDGLPLGSIVYDQMKALRAERLQRMGYETKLLAAIQTCQ